MPRALALNVVSEPGLARPVHLQPALYARVGDRLSSRTPTVQPAAS